MNVNDAASKNIFLSVEMNVFLDGTYYPLIYIPFCIYVQCHTYETSSEPFITEPVYFFQFKMGTPDLALISFFFKSPIPTKVLVIFFYHNPLVKISKP